MAGEVVGVVRGWLGALEGGDPAPEMCDPQVKISNWAESPVPGPYLGLGGVSQWWNDVAEALENVRFKVESVDAIDENRAVVSQRLVGTFRLTGIKLDQPWGAIVTVRDGKILSAVGYASPGEARRAAGLE